MQAGTCLLLRDVVVMQFIPPANGSSYFEVSAIFGDGNFDDIRRNATNLWNCLQKFYISVSMTVTASKHCLENLVH